MLTRTTEVIRPSNSANKFDACRLEHFNVNSLMKAIWLTMVASCVVNDETDEISGLLHNPHDSDTTAANAHTNNAFDIILIYWICLYLIGEIWKTNSEFESNLLNTTACLMNRIE